MKARNRPRAAGVPPATASNNTSTAHSTTVESSTLLQQAQAYRYNDTPPQQNVQSLSPAVQPSGTHPGNNPAYLNPFGERPSRDPSPVGRRFIDREFTHTRSRSDPIFLRNNASQGSQTVVQQQPLQQNTTHLQQNAIHAAQQQQMSAPQVTYAQQDVGTMPNFPKWNPFSNDFVLNTQTTDDDFASLREPAVQHGQQSTTRFSEPAAQHGQQGPPIFIDPTVQHGQQRLVEHTVQHGQREAGQAYAQTQFVSGNVRGHYFKQPSNSSLGDQRPSSNSNISPYASDSSRRSSDCDDEGSQMTQPKNDYFGSSRKNNAFFGGPVNAGCDMDEMTSHFNRNTTLHEPRRAQSEHANDATCVFDSAPFRKPAKAPPVAQTPPAPPVSPGRDPFGAVPFKQREAAKLARRQAKKNKEQPRRVLPNVPTQARR